MGETERLIKEYRRKRKAIVAMGGQKAIDKRHQHNQLTARERLDYLHETLKEKQFEVNNWAAMELLKEIRNDTEYKEQAVKILKQTAKTFTLAGSYSANKV